MNRLAFGAKKYPATPEELYKGKGKGKAMTGKAMFEYVSSMLGPPRKKGEP